MWVNPDGLFIMENYVAKLNEYVTKNTSVLKYEDVACDGPDHIKTFTVRAVLNGKAYPDGVGINKKEARQQAAKNVLKGLLEETVDSTENAAEVPLTPVHQTGIIQTNYVSWLNEYGLKNKVTVKPVESTKLEANNTTQCCSFVVGDKEYPAATGTTKKEAKEEAAKLVYQEICGSKTTETGDEKCIPSAQPAEELSQNESKISDELKNLNVRAAGESFAETNFIGLVNTYCQLTSRTQDYVTEKRCGPAHDLQFFYKLVINNKEYPVGEGKSVKEAKQKAAQLAWLALQEQPDWDSKKTVKVTTVGQRLNETQSSDELKNLNVRAAGESFAETNFIGLVNTYCQLTSRTHDYVTEKRCGPAHDLQFFYKLVINNKEYPVGEGKSVKEAKQKAAQLAWLALQEQPDWDSKVSIRPTASGDGAPSTSSASSASSTTWESNESSSQNMSTSSDSLIIFADTSSPLKVQKTVKVTTVGQRLNETQSRFTQEFDSKEKLGSGAFGWVWKAKKKLTGKYFAVKIVHCEEKCLKEVETLSDLQHDNIVRFYDCWLEENSGTQWAISDDDCSSSESASNSASQYLYIQLELCDTKTLKAWIVEKNDQSPQDTKRREESLNIAQQIVRGVEYIHSKEKIHRDLKPANILFGLDGKVKIGDFGLVTRDDALMDKTADRGTPIYMAPEQFGKKYDRKVDIIPLGLIFLELLWKLSTDHERINVLLDAKYQTFPDEFSLSFPQEKKIIESMLCKEPEDRPEASAIRVELEKWAETFNTQKMCQRNATV